MLGCVLPKATSSHLCYLSPWLLDLVIVLFNLGGLQHSFMMCLHHYFVPPIFRLSKLFNVAIIEACERREVSGLAMISGDLIEIMLLVFQLLFAILRVFKGFNRDDFAMESSMYWACVRVCVCVLSSFFCEMSSSSCML